VVDGRIRVDGLKLKYGQEVEEEIEKLEKSISLSPLAFKYPPRWLAIKLLEEDEETIKMFKELRGG
jgi:ferrous iron transport protein B